MASQPKQRRLTKSSTSDLSPATSPSQDVAPQLEATPIPQMEDMIQTCVSRSIPTTEDTILQSAPTNQQPTTSLMQEITTPTTTENISTTKIQSGITSHSITGRLGTPDTPQNINQQVPGQSQEGQSCASVKLQASSPTAVDQEMGPLTAIMLTTLPPQEQKQLLGERLYPLISRMFPVMAAKITGMLLEFDKTELLHMLESHESLEAKAEEAVAVIKSLC